MIVKIFEQIMKGSTLEECYKCVGGVCDQWLDVLTTHGTPFSPVI